ncbi:MAG: alpha/beta hydrolase-fold protein [Planctomycetota bacterium]
MTQASDLKKIEDSWYSNHLGREMPIVRYGDYGAPVLFFPTAAADYLEYERFRLIDSIAHFVERGMINIFSIDSINKDAWLNEKIEPARRAEIQVAYDRYVAEEVVPYIRNACQTDDIKITTTGASFGAYHAMNETLKHPDLFAGAIAMSGCYDIRSSCDGHHDANVYFNNPVEFLPNIEDEDLLARLRELRITVVTGQGDYENPDYSKEMAGLLERKGIPVTLDLWGHDVKHDWPWWNRMLNHYLPIHCS